MKNKYQEQKDYAIGLLESNCHFTAPEVIDCIDKTLQELIDNYSKLLKAIDKASEELADADKLLNKYTNGEYISKDNWKEYLLKKKETRTERYRKRREECTKTY